MSYFSRLAPSLIVFLSLTLGVSDALPAIGTSQSAVTLAQDVSLDEEDDEEEDDDMPHQEPIFTGPGEFADPPPATVIPDPASEADVLPGRGVRLLEGDCRNLDDASEHIAYLNSAVSPEGGVVGYSEAMPVEISVSTIAFSFDTLFSTAHSIAITDAANSADIIACGELGGVLASGGSVTFGLREVDASGVHGVAHLVPHSENPDYTEVTVYLTDDNATLEIEYEP